MGLPGRGLHALRREAEPRPLPAIVSNTCSRAKKPPRGRRAGARGTQPGRSRRPKVTGAQAGGTVRAAQRRHACGVQFSAEAACRSRGAAPRRGSWQCGTHRCRSRAWRCSASAVGAVAAPPGPRACMSALRLPRLPRALPPAPCSPGPVCARVARLTRGVLRLHLVQAVRGQRKKKFFVTRETNTQRGCAC